MSTEDIVTFANNNNIPYEEKQLYDSMTGDWIDMIVFIAPNAYNKSVNSIQKYNNKCGVN